MLSANVTGGRGAVNEISLAGFGQIAGAPAGLFQRVVRSAVLSFWGLFLFFWLDSP
jgi:hypothetical protein